MKREESDYGTKREVKGKIGERKEGKKRGRGEQSKRRGKKRLV